jgi:hypothetical protein
LFSGFDSLTLGILAKGPELVEGRTLDTLDIYFGPLTTDNGQRTTDNWQALT